MDAMRRPGHSSLPEPSGPALSGLNLEMALEGYFTAATQIPQDPWQLNPASPDCPSINRPFTDASLPSWEEAQNERWEKLALMGTDSPYLDEEDFFALVTENDLQTLELQEGCAILCTDSSQQVSSQRSSSQHLDGNSSGLSDVNGSDIFSNPPSEEAERLALRQGFYINVLRAAEPLTMPGSAQIVMGSKTKRVQRLLPPMTAEEQASYVPWTAQLGTAALDAINPASLDDEDLLNYIQATERQASWAMARQAAAINEFATRRPPVSGEDPPAKHPDRSRYAAAELMAMFAIGAGAAEKLLSQAELLCQYLPDTLEQFKEGSLDVRRINAILLGCENTPPHILHCIEEQFLSCAMNRNPNALTRRVRSLAERHNPEPLEVRHRRARTGRDVWITPLPDGMACLGARLPAIEATLLFNSLDEWARSAKSRGDDSHGTTPTGRPSRSLSEYRADILVDLLHEVLLHSPSTGQQQDAQSRDSQSNDSRSPHFRKRVPVTLNIMVPIDRLLGHGNEPSILEDYGPIPIDDVHELAATAKTWRRFLSDPDTGHIVSIGRKSRKPPKAMAREVRFKDPVCTGIGCDRPARACELDHTAPFHQRAYTADGTLLPPGETSLENLRPRCPYCHHVKDDANTGWTVENVSPGAIKTTTPTGRIYLQSQGDIEPPF